MMSVLEHASTEATPESMKPTTVPEALKAITTPETMKPIATPARQRHVLKKEPILAPNEFIVRTEHNEHQCPKDGCGKTFRKENLLQMHIKHYHPELLKKSSRWAPNVADLAYARTVGDHLDTSSSPTHASPPSDKIIKTETGSKKTSRGVNLTSSLDARAKVGDKKAPGSIKTTLPSKELKKKEKTKLESDQGMMISEDEIESKEEIEEFLEDVENESPLSTTSVQPEDPDYIPAEDDLLHVRKDRLERRKTRGESKSGKKKKIVSSESLCEDDQQETKTVTKYRYCKQKGVASSKANVTPANAELLLQEGSSASPSKKSQGPEGETQSIDAEEDTRDTWTEGTEGVPPSETSAEIINCGCGSTEEEGLMLQCDVCMCWQHGDCYNIVGEDQVPDKYICSLCDHPRLERSSHKFRHHQDWLKEGRLPRFSFSSSRGDLRLEACIRRGHELTANVEQLSQVLHSLRLKLHIAKEADHPKFVMWHKKWDEQEENFENKEKSYTNSSTVIPLQELMNIVEQEAPSLSTKIIDTKIPDDQTCDLNSNTTLEKTTIEGLKGGHETSLVDSSGRWNVSDQQTTEIQKSDAPADHGKKEMLQRDQNSINNETFGVSENITTGVAENVSSDSSDFSEIKVPKDNKQKENLLNVESANIQGSENELQLLSSSENHPDIQETGSVLESEEKIFQVEEKSLEISKIRTAEEECKNSLESSHNPFTVKTKDADETVNVSSENSDLATKSEIVPEKVDEEEKPSDKYSSKDETSNQVKETISHTSKETEKDIEPLVQSHREEVEVKDEGRKGEKKADSSVESDSLIIKEENTNECLKESSSSNEVNTKDEAHVKQPKEESIEYSNPVDVKDEIKADNTEEKDSNFQETVVQDSSIIEETDLPKASLMVEKSNDMETESVKMKDESTVEKKQIKDKEQEQSPESLSMATSGVSHSATEDSLNEEETHLEDGDDLALDLGGLGGAGESGMPGGSELADLLSSQAELEQFVSQASSALVPVSSDIHPVRPPIIPEAERIEPGNCKLNLLEHVQGVQTSIIQRFDEIEQQLEVLEAEMGLTPDGGEEETEDDTEERDPATLQARALIKLVMNDLSIVKKIAEFTH